VKEGGAAVKLMSGVRVVVNDALHLCLNLHAQTFASCHHALSHISIGRSNGSQKGAAE